MSTELVQAGGSLAIRPDQTMWSPQQEAVLRQSGINNDVTSAELSAFLHLCQRTKLDPFSRQIYLIGRYDRRANRQVYTPQTSIDGYRVIASRVVTEQGANLGYEDTQWCDKDGRWTDVWLADTPPAAAKVTVLRNGQRFPSVALFREYVQTGKENKPIGLWGKMPAGQLAKCAEALALRKAFPHDLAGVYTAEEMAQADNPQPERHLRTVQPSDDQWATAPTHVQQTPPEVVARALADVPPESLTPNGRDYLHEARQAPDADIVRRIWVDARAEGARPEYLDQIAEVGKAIAHRPVARADGQQPAGDVVEGEVIPDADDEHATAVADLRAFAAQAGLNDIDNDAYGALGLPLADATPGAIRDFLRQLRGSAA